MAETTEVTLKYTNNTSSKTFSTTIGERTYTGEYSVREYMKDGDTSGDLQNSDISLHINVDKININIDKSVTGNYVNISSVDTLDAETVSVLIADAYKILEQFADETI